MDSQSNIIPTTRPRVMHTVESAAQLLSISRTRVYELIKNGEIFSVRIGRLRRIPDDALRDFVRALTADQQAA
ncbi:excisionase family DNA-binding protein [Pseudonocardia spinosispora]|uniref:excisionase family DNA-binding protein n=1 Tax=Pseudonocardia spinosispora TaxID=103441 RepID=UPI00041EDD2C|nr:excisionase family DNA-binding protein [Pseudonocardia spinosispora]